MADRSDFARDIYADWTVQPGYTFTVAAGATLALATGSSLTGTESYVGTPSIDLIGANAAVFYYVHPTGAPDVTIESIDSRLSGALATGDATITASIATDGVTFTPVTSGAITITQAASATGDMDVATPSAANTVTAGDTVRLLVGGTNTAAVFAAVYMRLRS